MTNASLIIGVAAAAPDRKVVILAGIAGLVAGAFSMAVGEFMSMSVQREMFELQIALEREELEQNPPGALSCAPVRAWRSDVSSERGGADAAQANRRPPY